jgi:two-component system cell cycle sensor histidine kinase/response regulator CckA
VALHQQPAAWHGALDASPLPTLVVGEDVTVVYANQAARRLFGLAGDQATLEGLRGGAVLGCAEAEKPGGCGQQATCPTCNLRRAVQAAQRGEPVRRDAARMSLRDGAGLVRERNLLVSAAAVTRELLGHVVLVLEPDEEIDAQLRRELETTLAILDAVPVPVFVKGPGRRFVYVNQEAARALGRDASDVIGLTDADFFPPEVVRRLWVEDDRVLIGGEGFEAEQSFQDLPGGVRTVLVRKRRGTGARGEPLLLSTGTDITELKRAQLALEESQRRVEDGLATLRGVLEATDSAIFSVDRELRYTSFNGNHAATMRSIYGAEIAVGRPLSECMAVSEDWAVAKVNIERVLAGESFLADAFSGDAGRSRRYFEINHAPVRAGDGAVIGAAVFARDVTGRRVTELALRESEDKLRQAQRIEAVGRLAGGIAHDFNNLLTVIMASADFGLEETVPGSPLRDELEEIRGAGKRAQALTRQLLAFSRRQVLQPQVVDLNANIREIERMLGRVLGEDVAVRLHLDPGTHRIFIDPGQLEQVILNLAVNARDAMPSGGKLTIETANVVLDAAYAALHAGATSGPQVMMAISDTGGGMDAATLERIFEPFFTTKAKGKGTGLGLSTVHGIVKQSGGSVSAYSEPGRGTTFKVYLPLAPAEAEAKAPVAQVAPLQARSGESLLVVEDDDQVRRAAVRCLERLGYQVTAASGIAEVTRILDQGRTFSALLTDMIMPGGSGADVARLVAARLPGIRLIFMSGYTDDAITQQGVLAPGALFLEKPFTPETLGRKIREALDQPVMPG